MEAALNFQSIKFQSHLPSLRINFICCADNAASLTLASKHIEPEEKRFAIN